MRKLLFLFLVCLFSLNLRAETYFIHLTPSGTLQRTALLTGTNTVLGSLQKNSTDIRFKSLGPNKVFSNWITLQGPISDIPNYLNTLKNNELIDQAEPVHAFRVTEISNDSLIDNQWYLNKIQVFDAWEKSSGNASVIVGLIDTGVDYKHPDLQTALWKNYAEINGVEGVDDDQNGYVDDRIGWDFTDAPSFPDGGDYLSEDNDPMDEFSHGHGTQCAGIIAATRNNQKGISGIAPNCRVMVLRAGTASGYLEEDDVARAILYAIDNGAKIINMSFGDVALSTLLRDVIHYAYTQGVTLVASAGNNQNDQSLYPAALSETISVGASTSKDKLAGFSSFGSTVDLTAPGDSIISTSIGGGYNIVNGTSFSAPMVSAVSALILSEQPNLDPERVRNILKTTTDDMLYYGWDEYSGAGRVNAYKAVSVEHNGILEITQPGSNLSIAADTLWIEGTLSHPDLLNGTLEYGIGKNPTQWIIFQNWEHQQIFKDTLGFIPLQTIPDTTLELKLTLNLINGNHDELHREVVIDRTPPILSNISALSMYNAGHPAVLISLKSDDVCKAEVHFHKCSEPNVDHVIPFAYLSNRPIQKIDLEPDNSCYRFYVKATNRSGLVTIDDNKGNFYEFASTYSIDPLNPISFKTGIPAGYLLEYSDDLDHDSLREIILSVYDADQGFGPIRVYEASSTIFSKVFETNFRAIPRASGDVDSDGKSDLLLSYGSRAFLFESNTASSYPDQLVWLDTLNFWAAGYIPLPLGEQGVVGRRDMLYEILSISNDNQFSQIMTLPNSSSGENKYGVPKVVHSDFSGDGQEEVAYGDLDGDVLVYTISAENKAHLLAQLKTTQSDATALLSASDQDLFVLSHTADPAFYEHEIDARFWTLDRFHFDRNAKAFTKQTTLNFYGYKNLKDFDSGLSTGTLNGTQYLFVALYPVLYVFRIEDSALQLVLYKENVKTNSILTGILSPDGQEAFYYNNGTEIIGQALGEKKRPNAPTNFHVSALDSERIRLKWDSVSGAKRYRIYRGNQMNTLTLYDSCQTTFFTDSMLQREVTYYYSVSAIDTEFFVHESNSSNLDSGRTSFPPRLIGLEYSNDHQSILEFNEPLQILPNQNPRITLIHTGLKASSVQIMPKKKKLLCSFNESLSGKTDSIRVSAIFDLAGVPLDIRYNSLPFQYNHPNKSPYIKKVQLLNRYQVLIEFSQPMQCSTISDPENYLLSPSGFVKEVSVEDSLCQKIFLKLSSSSMAGALGSECYLQTQNLLSQSGEALEPNQSWNLFIEPQNLDLIKIYPQPVTPQQSELIFANIPENTEISVFNLNGKRIWQTRQAPHFGGIHWNLQDQTGKRVPSGVYIYRIINQNKHKTGKLVLVR